MNADPTSMNADPTSLFEHVFVDNCADTRLVHETPVAKTALKLRRTQTTECC